MGLEGKESGSEYYLLVMRIGLLSDTHSFIDPRVFEYFGNCDEVWHAGDIGDGIAEQLEAFKPFKAVYGNIDSKEIQIRYPEHLRFVVEGFSVWITHIAGSPPNYKPHIKKLLTQSAPHLFICGHSHILKIARDAQFNNMIFINPGAAGNHGFHHMKTLVRFEISNGEMKNLEVIELGKRGQIIG
jgi:putative phosphoesterase